MTTHNGNTTHITHLRSNRHGTAIESADPVWRCNTGNVVPKHINLAKLAQAYNVVATAHISRPQLMVEARKALLKYKLSKSDLEVASNALTHTMRNHLEQKGMATLSADLMTRIEHDVLAYCGIRSTSAHSKS